MNQRTGVKRLVLFILCLTLLDLMSSPLVAQTREEGPWWPHPQWGAGDQAGASNWITPEKILEAITLVETGQVYELGHIYERGMFLLGDRSYASFLVPGEASSVGGSVYNDDYLAAEIGQVGTQFDGLGHVGRRVQMEDGSIADVFYNGFALDEMFSRYGLTQLGVEHMKPFITRGILIDLAASKGLETLPNGYRATLSDVQEALAAQGLTEEDIRPGDAILFNMGWTGFWNDPERIRRDWSIRPIVDGDVLDWLIERKPSVVGWDTAADGAGHQRLTMENGIPSIEFMKLDELAADRVFDFLFVFTPLRFKGATGSPGRPLAIR